MRRPLVAGNWKMNLDRAGGVALARSVVEGAAQLSGVDLAIFPPAVYLEAVGAIVRGSSVALGAQNVYFEKAGAFTGELSTAMLLDMGCQYVILGHSERRHILGESDELVGRKVTAALDAGLLPVLCVGETLAEREADQTVAVVTRQFELGLAGVTASRIETVVLAYEPVWAIGTGRVATPAQAQEVHAELRKLLAKRYNAAAAASVRILYGGSVKPDNSQELLAQGDIDGALVGGACLKAADFLAIAATAPQNR